MYDDKPSIPFHNPFTASTKYNSNRYLGTDNLHAGDTPEVESKTSGDVLSAAGIIKGLKEEKHGEVTHLSVRNIFLRIVKKKQGTAEINCSYKI